MTFFALCWLFIASLCIVFGGLNAKNIFSHTKTAVTQGSVKKVHTVFPAGQNDTSPSCDFSYSFKVANNVYNESSGSVASTSYCDLTTGSTITVHYNPQDPSENGLSNSDGIVGAAFVVIGIVIMGISIFSISKSRDRMDDRATSAQITLIESGLQDLGEYWQPHSMTRAEAEQTIDNINSRLVAQNKKALR